jgi:hypothetical protein
MPKARGAPSAPRTPAPGPTAKGLIYLYAILEPGTPAHAALRAGRMAGLHPDAPLFPIEVAGLVAAVSRVPAEQFQEEPLNALLADLSRLAPLAVQHEAAIRALLPLAPALIPTAFGAVYQGTERIADLLRERGAELRSILDRVRDKQEWGLKVFGDPAALRHAAELNSPELRHLADETAAAGPGRAYLLGKRRERLLAQETSRFVADVVDRLVERFAAHSADTLLDNLSAAQAHLAEPRGKAEWLEPRLLAKAAFLVHASQVDAFQAQADDLRRTHAPLGLTLELSGPWAPYSFVGVGRGVA